MIKKHFRDKNIEVYKHTKLADFIGYDRQFEKTKLIGLTKFELIMILAGYELGEQKNKIFKKLSTYYGLSAEVLEEMHKEETV